MNSYIYEFKDLPSTDTPFNAETFTAMQNKLLDSVYPIGSIMIKDDATDYSSYLGFTWEKVFAGVTLVGLDADQEEFNEIGKTGGEKTHKLIVDEIPPLDVNVRARYGSSSTSAGALDWYNTSTTDYAEYNLGRTNSGGQAHNNLPPYQVVVFWKRVA